MSCHKLGFFFVVEDRKFRLVVFSVVLFFDNYVFWVHFVEAGVVTVVHLQLYDMRLDLLLDEKFVISELLKGCLFHLLVDSFELVFNSLNLTKIHLEHNRVIIDAYSGKISALHELTTSTSCKDI